MSYIEWLGKNTDDEEGLIAYAAAEHERKRIIKLFEDFIAKQSSYINDETPADIAEGYLVEIESAEYWIDRIKGENK